MKSCNLLLMLLNSTFKDATFLCTFSIAPTVHPCGSHMWISHTPQRRGAWLLVQSLGEYECKHSFSILASHYKVLRQLHFERPLQGRLPAGRQACPVLASQNAVGSGS